MNKGELVVAIAERADMPKSVAARAVDALIGVVTDELKSGGEVSLVGFGSFSVKDRAGRTGRNPQNGKPIQIEAAKRASFKAGKTLNDSLN